ncbi:MAG: UTP--glucose-1-phosphate uridylyltransferase GalU, partial [Parcubacteria group bacterium]
MAKKKIRKVVIPAAGYGTRFLPATKAQPKEMLPIVDKPIIQYVVEEAVASGIEDVIIVTGWQKRSIEDHFDYPFELEKRLEKAGKLEQLEEVRKIAQMANFIYVRQKGPYGNGTPVLCAKHVVGNEPFAVLWGDEFIASEPPRLSQMIKMFEKTGQPLVSAIRIDNRRELSKYGIADVEPSENGLLRIKRIVEKPDPDTAPSNLAAHGGYIFTPDIFPMLEKTQPGRDNEVWLVDAINALITHTPVYAVEIQKARYYDTGNKLEYLKANIEFALRRQ